MRIAIISTPRSGNTWLRYMLAGLYNAEQIAIHSPNDLDWDSLSDGNIILQLHWHRTPEFVSLLNQHNFMVIVLQRHPLDVLISILQFAHQEPQTARWLDGESGGEAAIFESSPSDGSFLKYAISQRASALFSVSMEWGRDIDASVVKYEDLVRDTSRVLRGLVDRFGKTNLNISDVVEANNIRKLRASTKNGHFWQGNPGLWKDLIPYSFVEKIVEEHKAVFLELDYSYKTGEKVLMKSEAAERWALLCELDER